MRKSLSLLACFLLLEGGAPRLFAQESSAKIAGVILDPAGRPAVGFRVMLRDTSNNTLYTSAPTDAAGSYAIHVPVGGPYAIEGVRADDGVTKLTVQDAAPVIVREAGTIPLNVRFIRGSTPENDEQQKKKKPKSGMRWYERPGPIVGMVFGAGALAAVALSGGDSNASPSQPGQPWRP